MQHTEASLATFAQKESQRFRLKTGVLLFLVQNNHILLSRRYKTGIDDGNYVVPMGGIEGGEPLTSAIVREAQEEANIILEPTDLRVCHVMHRYHPMPKDLSFEQIDVYFYATTYAGIIKNNEPHKCDDLAFFPLNNLPKNIAPFIQSAL
jgi:8-oxo-dGTP diphosphatase